MDISQRLQEISSNHYAVAGVGIVLVLFLLLKIGMGLLKKAVLFVGFLVLVAIVLLSLQ
jgi:hypothetical protein